DTAEIRKIRHGASGAIKYHISVADPRKGGIHVIRYVHWRAGDLRVVKAIIIYLAICHIILVSGLILNLIGFNFSAAVSKGSGSMEFKDIITIGVSAAAFVTSCFAFYYSHLYKPSSAVLTRHSAANLGINYLIESTE
ncbi:hypothetical protein ABMX71_23715, partial [Vibrio vulnificus]